MGRDIRRDHQKNVGGKCMTQGREEARSRHVEREGERVLFSLVSKEFLTQVRSQLSSIIFFYFSFPCVPFPLTRILRRVVLVK